MKIKFILTYALIFVFTLNLIASDIIPGKPQNKPIALVGGTIHTITQGTIENGVVLFDKGKIIAVGKNVNIPKDAEIINISGKHVYPGLINAFTTVGLIEIGAVRATRDVTEVGLINPNVRAEVAFNPDSEHPPVTRANGITTVLVVPTGELIAGQSALMMLDGWTWEEMTLKAPVGLHIYWPRMIPPSTVRFSRQSPEELKKETERRLQLIRETFQKARAYKKAKESEAQKGIPYHETDLKYEAMIPVLEGKVPVFVHANSSKEILSAIEWAESEKVKIVIVGGSDAWKVADVLKNKNIPVILTNIHRLPSTRDSEYDEPFTVAYKLYKAGVKFCIGGEGGYYNERNLPYQAATCAAFGLPKDEALKAITIYPAEILGVADKVGSIEPGKDATLIVTTGDPLEIPTQVVYEFIQGRKVDLTNRQTKLYEKYLEKYRRLGLLK
ncbi:Imidazolonepropionase [Candidatus Kryptonium thompsonii]|jgi:imidazolonepropionase-like amidohydrolase|uniref:Imidazolonepropionase n=1 Tax=Candidatus Kryptonium thompsonii TaxID=1633631 RepID=A0A0P1M7I1_9BACT|nr:amidohydrolase family protein [Candidatus Kryptonium thompsoni]CUS82864.1 Imidazolonepropionase [Candidatus Kryptonium thompsoni]CUS83100.1 Imidazolonepropionase [Candidatus Kryptonium thompsoni]CUS88148.1 Imidazolonepropionase [Candidatus Kryptonium thompsoni]CUS90740.1 Imidazolonepropionase [Candidatus Kryptonium thompsoni]CUS93430.1 Imidazolonepropionase [Candidatus Kryptonium thompsoni]